MGGAEVMRNKSRSFTLKIIFIILVAFGFSGSLFAGFTVLSDIGQKTCIVEGMTQAECDNDIQCMASKKVCEIALDNLGGTLEAEAIGQIIKYGGQGAVYASKKLANLGFSNTKSITTELLGKVGNAMKHNSGIKKAKGLSPNEIAKVFSEIVFSIAVDEYVDHLPQGSFDSVRRSGIPGFSGASNDVIAVSMKRLIMLAKNNFIFLISPNKITAARDAIIADGLILAEIGVDVANSSVEATESSLALAKSEKSGEMLELYINYRKTYFTDSRKQPNKYSILNEFETQCAKIKLSGLESFWASLRRDDYSLSSINGGLRSRCSEYSKDMQEDERTKYEYIRVASTFSSTQYEKIINIYFPPSLYGKLIQFYKVSNFDYGLRISKSLQAREYLRRYLSYDNFTLKAERYIRDTLSEDGLFLPDTLMKEYLINNLLWTAYVSIYPRTQNIPFSWMDKNNNNQGYVTRAEFAKQLVDKFSLDSKLSKKKIEQSALYAAFSFKWTKEATFLRELGIVKGYTGANDFKPDQPISALEALVMTVNTMDVLKCGHVQCDILEIIGVKQ